MNKTFFLTMSQVDAVNLSLSKAMAIAQIVAECGGERRLTPGNAAPGSLFVVMQVLTKELENVGNIIEGLKKLK